MLSASPAPEKGNGSNNSNLYVKSLCQSVLGFKTAPNYWSYIFSSTEITTTACFAHDEKWRIFLRASVQGTILMLILSLTPFVMTGYCLKEADMHDNQIFCGYSLQDLLYYTPWCKVNMASESATTSPPALAGSSFSIENLLNLSQGATEKKPTAKLATASSACDSLRRPSFPLVPQVVRPFAYHAHSLPLCTPNHGINFGGILHPRTKPSINHFPIPRNGPPLGKLKRGVHSINTYPCYIVPVARKVRLVATPLHFILHSVNGWKSSHIRSWTTN